MDIILTFHAWKDSGDVSGSILIPFIHFFLRCKPFFLDFFFTWYFISVFFKHSKKIMFLSKVMQSSKEEVPNIAAPATFSQKHIMPSSLSQVDSTVFQELPEELRKDIIEHLAKHQGPESKGALSNVSDKQIEVEASDLNDLWVGNPPKWVMKFQISNCSMFNYFVEVYQSGSGGCLSSILQCMMSRIFVLTDVRTVGFGDAVTWLCELFRQYIDLKITTDVEEIYVCVCLLRR